MDLNENKTPFNRTSDNLPLHTEPFPISAFPSEILWRIFELNATSVGSHRALTTSIRTSQVCHEWREMMMGSSVLWGRLIVFDHPFILKSLAWRSEILRRSGSAPLWIQGVIETREINVFLLSLLNIHWERVQVLDVRPARYTIYSSPQESQLWDVLLRPAPILQVFKILQSFHPLPLCESSKPLFTNYAPRLKVFHCEWVGFSLNAPWISHIEDIRFMAPLTLSDVLGPLTNMEGIRYLHIESLNADNVHHYPRINLPQLKELLIKNCARDVWLSILESVVPGPGCSFNLVANMDYQPPEAISQTACELLFKFIRNIFLRPAASYLRLKASDVDNRFGASLHNGRGESQLSIDLWDHNILSHLVIERLASASLFSDVKTLQLYIIDDPQDLPHKLSSLISSLPSITSLQTSDMGIKFLLEFCEPDALPNLHTLIFHHLWQRSNWPALWKRQYPFGPIMAFLLHRKAIGLPISLIDLSDKPLSKLYNMDFLERISGLIVRYKNPVDKTVVHYQCGSGQSQNLRFQSNHAFLSSMGY